MNKYRKKPVVIEAIQLTKDSVFTVIALRFILVLVMPLRKLLGTLIRLLRFQTIN